MFKKIFIMLIAGMFINGGSPVFAAAVHRESITDKFVCVICLSKEAPQLAVLDERAVVCSGPGAHLVMHQNLEGVEIAKKGHCMHVVCLGMWLEAANTCPACRREFLPEERGVLGVASAPARLPDFDSEAFDPAEDFLNAAATGNEARVRYFLQHGMNVHTVDGIGRTPLHLAVGGGCVDVVQFLLSIPGINVNMQDRFFKATPLLRAVENIGNPLIIQALLAAGALPNIPGCFGFMPLHKAALGDYPGVVKMLLDAGAEINAQNEFGNTPLHNAANKGYTSVINVLLSYGARKNIVNVRGQSAYAVAISRGYVEAAALLG